MKMYLEILLLIIAISVLVYLSFHFAGTLLSPTTQQNLKNKVCFGQKCFSVQLARTNAEREKGLMSVKQLGRDKGMLFIFDKEGIYPFWMKNTLIPLDIIWIDDSPAGENKVVFIAENVQPCKTLICPSIVPSVKAKYVLEINAGISKEIDIKVGDYAIINKVKAD